MKIIHLIFAAILLSTSISQATTSIHPDHKPEHSFYAEWVKNQVIISWEGNMEGVYFEIEYSNDGENFEPIVTSERNSMLKDGEVTYYIDSSRSIESYYRLMQITKEGNIVYSDIIHVSPLPKDLTLGGLK